MNKISCKFKYECDKSWDDLLATEADNIRHCDACKQYVFLVEAQSEFDKYASEGKCVAIETIEYVMLGKPKKS